MKRMIAYVKAKNSNAVKLMICDKGRQGVFVFGYATLKSTACAWDCHYLDLEDAYEMGIDYGINREDWQTIPSPPEGHQDDWIEW